MTIRLRGAWHLHNLQRVAPGCDELLDGGAGEDYIDGESDNDTYHFDAGSERTISSGLKDTVRSKVSKGEHG